jgi:hypothetical protein
VDGVHAFLDFDPERMIVVDASGQPASEITPGSALGVTLLNEVDPGRGYVSFMAASTGAAAPDGTFTVATLRLRAVKAGSHMVRFSFSAWRETAVTSGGEPALGGVYGARINVPAGQRTFLPIIVKP